MSELNPEVGDLWEYRNRINRIGRIERGEIINDNVVGVYELSQDGGLERCWLYEKTLKSNGKYIGKSKASIKDLFETEEITINKSENNKLTPKTAVEIITPICVKENAENVTQTDLHNINDIQFPPRHDKTAYELQIENNKLKAEIESLRCVLKQMANENPDCFESDLTAQWFIDIAKQALNSESER